MWFIYFLGDRSGCRVDAISIQEGCAWGLGEKDTCVPGDTENEGKSGVVNVVSGTSVTGPTWSGRQKKMELRDSTEMET